MSTSASTFELLRCLMGSVIFNMIDNISRQFKPLERLADRLYIGLKLLENIIIANYRATKGSTYLNPRSENASAQKELSALLGRSAGSSVGR